MDAIVELTSLGATRYGGNWSHLSRAKALAAGGSAARPRRRRTAHRRELVERTQATVERQSRRDGAGAQARREGRHAAHPARAPQGRAARTTGGGGARLAERRRAQAEAEAQPPRAARIEVLQPLAVTPGADRPAGGPHRAAFRPRDVRPCGRTNPPPRTLASTITGPERVGVTGAERIRQDAPFWRWSPAGWPRAPARSMPFRDALPCSTRRRACSILPPRSATTSAGSIRAATRTPAARRWRGFLFRADAALQPAGTLSGGQMLRAGAGLRAGRHRPPSAADAGRADQPSRPRRRWRPSRRGCAPTTARCWWSATTRHSWTASASPAG